MLYIEDNLANLRVMERFMRDRSEHLEVAMQAGLGIELARELRPAVILLDLHLPDMHGSEALAALKADPHTAPIPVIVVSADATEGTIRRLYELGVHTYLTKPPDLAQLAALLDELTDDAGDRADESGEPALS